MLYKGVASAQLFIDTAKFLEAHNITPKIFPDDVNVKVYMSVLNVDQAAMFQTVDLLNTSYHRWLGSRLAVRYFGQQMQ